MKKKKMEMKLASFKQDKGTEEINLRYKNQVSEVAKGLFEETRNLS